MSGDLGIFGGFSQNEGYFTFLALFVTQFVNFPEIFQQSSNLGVISVMKNMILEDHI